MRGSSRPRWRICCARAMPTGSQNIRLTRIWHHPLGVRHARNRPFSPSLGCLKVKGRRSKNRDRRRLWAAAGSRLMALPFDTLARGRNTLPLAAAAAAGTLPPLTTTILPAASSPAVGAGTGIGRGPGSGAETEIPTVTEIAIGTAETSGRGQDTGKTGIGGTIAEIAAARRASHIALSRGPGPPGTGISPAVVVTGAMIVPVHGPVIGIDGIAGIAAVIVTANVVDPDPGPLARRGHVIVIGLEAAVPFSQTVATAAAGPTGQRAATVIGAGTEIAAGPEQDVIAIAIATGATPGANATAAALADETAAETSPPTVTATEGTVTITTTKTTAPGLAREALPARVWTASSSARRKPKHTSPRSATPARRVFPCRGSTRALTRDLAPPCGRQAVVG
jgi:hypothetical protein